MRLIHVLVPNDRREGVLEVLDGEGVDYVRTEDLEGREASLVEFPLPAQAVEVVMEQLRDAGLDDEYVVIASAETARTRNFGELEDRFVEGEEEDESIAHEEIRAKALDMTPNPQTYYAMTLLAAVVATAGVLLDSPSIVVGSMVIAPQVGSALTASVGTVLNDRTMLWDGIRTQVLGLLLAVVGATAFGWLLKSTDFVPSMLTVTTVEQISQRISPGLLSVSVGFSAGAAGALGLATALPVSLVGVMIAAALIPAAAAVGIGIAWNLPTVALGAAVLLVVNMLSINVAGVGVLWYLGYRPHDWRADGGSFGAALRDAYPAVAVFVGLCVLFAASGVVIADQMQFENRVNEAVEGTLSEGQYDDLQLVSVHTEFTAIDAVQSGVEVSVVVQRPRGYDNGNFAGSVERRVEERTGTNVSVGVEFVDRHRSDDR